jgi:hypothetical protein
MEGRVNRRSKTVEFEERSLYDSEGNEMLLHCVAHLGSWHLHKRTLTAAGMTRDAYIYAAMCRWFQLLLNDHQLAAMQNERYDKINERLIASRPSEDTTTYLEPVTDQPFKATCQE